MWKMGYTTYHTCSIFTDNCFKEVIHNWAHSNRNKLLFCLLNSNWTKINMQVPITYPTRRYLGLTVKQYKLVKPSNPHIWVYGTRDRLNMPKNYFQPSSNPMAYNLNIDTLFSTDYITFETEYYKLINRFNLTSCLNRVRAFILLVLERENYISKFY
jgi:hypothetical protein